MQRLLYPDMPFTGKQRRMRPRRSHRQEPLQQGVHSFKKASDTGCRRSSSAASLKGQLRNHLDRGPSRRVGNANMEAVGSVLYHRDPAAAAQKSLAVVGA